MSELRMMDFIFLFCISFYVFFFIFCFSSYLELGISMTSQHSHIRGYTSHSHSYVVTMEYGRIFQNDDIILWYHIIYLIYIGLKANT